MNASQNWRLSRFAHFIPLGNTTAIYNSLNMALFFLGNKLATCLKQGYLLSEAPENPLPINKMVDEKILVKINYDDLTDYRRIQNQHSKLPVKILYLLLTDDCNFACRYCYIKRNFPLGHHPILMTTDVAKDGIDLYARALATNLIQEKYSKRIIFYGGEPLLNFPTMVFAINYIETLKQEGRLPRDVRLSLITNGSLITPKIAKILAEHHISVSVSVDGGKEIHNQERIFPSGKGTFNATIQGFKLLKKFGVNPGISCTITDSGVYYIEDTLNFLIDKLGVHSIGFNILRKNHTSKFADSENYIQKVSHALINAFKIARKKGVYEDRMMRKVRTFIKRVPCLNDCAGCGSEIAVAPDGKVGVCHGAVGLKDYYITNTSELNIHTHPYWTEWRSRSPFNMPECIDCVALGICGGGCPYEAYLREGSIWAVEKLFCIHAKTTLEFLIRDLYEKLSSH